MAKLTKLEKENLILDALEKDEEGKNKYTQQELADKYKISKSMVNRYVQQKVNTSKQIIPEEIECRVNLKKIEEEKSELFTLHEQQKVNNYIEQTVNTILYIDSCIRKNQELTDILQTQLEESLKTNIRELEKGTNLSQQDIFNALNMIDGFSRVSTRNRMAILPKDFNPDNKDDKEEQKEVIFRRLTHSNNRD